jgi:glycosyltransferase Alg8
MTVHSPRAAALRSALLPVLLYGACSYLFLYWMREGLHPLHPQVLLTFGVLAFWRYSWQLVHIARAAWYATWHYPRLRAAARSVAAQRHCPRRIFVVLPTYLEEPWVCMESMQSLMSNLAGLPCKATVIASVGSDQDESVLATVWQAHPARERVELVFQRQSQGKRIALGYALRAVARRYDDEPDSITVLMDGDTWLEPGTLDRVLPFFIAYRDLGAITTNETAYIPGSNAWYRDWFGLKFGLRHVLFQSHSLSHKVLTLTGRFSAFRTSIVVAEDFLQMMENDTIDHWLHGRFRFLMGDDKTSWFYVLRAGWNMLYLPDVTVVSLESREAGFLRASVSLPYRWYGNTMRNNPRALALGPWRTGLFIWLVLLDQRLSMWTSLVGISGATVMAITKSLIFLPMYVAWAALVRSVQLIVIAANGHRVSLRTIPIMLYTHWVGSVVKIRAWHHLADQSWSKGNAKQSAHVAGGPLRRLAPTGSMLIAYLAFALVILLAHSVLRLPGAQLFAAETSAAIDGGAQGVPANDGRDAAGPLQALIDRQPPGPVTIRLPAGQLEFRQPLVIRRDRVTLTGAGPDRTRIVSHMTAPAEAVIRVEGQQGHRIGYLAQALGENDTVLRVDARKAVAIEPGTLVWLKEPNDDAFLQRLGSEKWNREYPYLRQALVLVAGRDPDGSIRLAAPTGVNFDAGRTEVWQPQPVRGVRLADLTVEQLAAGHNIAEVAHVYENVLPQFDVDAISLFFTQNAVIEHVNVRNAGRHPISIEQSHGFLVRDCLLDGAWNKGDKGSGYLRIARSYRGTVENCQVRNIRHIALQWSSAFNTLRNIDSEVDVNFHGGFSHDNRVEDVRFAIPPQHHWGPVYHTPNDAHWAPPDGPRNVVVNAGRSSTAPQPPAAAPGH